MSAIDTALDTGFAALLQAGGEAAFLNDESIPSGVLWDEAYQVLTPVPDRDVGSTAPAATGWTDELQDAGLARGSWLERDSVPGTLYYVLHFESDGQGVTKLILSKSQPPTAS